MSTDTTENKESGQVNEGSEQPEILQSTENKNEIVVLPEDQEPKEKKPSRYGKTANFSPAEFEYLNGIFEKRNEAGLSEDWNHFLRQCVDFAVNSREQQNLTFAVPDVPVQYLKNAFFKPNK